MESVYLIVGLGNPGRQYARTRHNVGFMVAEQLVGRQRAAWSVEQKFQARLARWVKDHRQVWVCAPQTYMNASGEAVRSVMDYHRVPLERLLVVVDDADLPLGSLRLRPEGGAGGHHGLESVQQQVGSTKYARLRVGIGRMEGQREISGHVLGRFTSEETPCLEQVLARASDQMECWITHGIRRAMNDFNGTICPPDNEGKNL